MHDKLLGVGHFIRMMTFLRMIRIYIVKFMVSQKEYFSMELLTILCGSGQTVLCHFSEISKLCLLIDEAGFNITGLSIFGLQSVVACLYLAMRAVVTKP